MKDASLVIEDLKLLPKTYKEFKKSELPEGLKAYYRQAFQSLSLGDRQTLLVALRWVMCGEGEIDVTLVADDHDRVYDEEDSDSSDNSSPSDTEASISEVDFESEADNYENKARSTFSVRIGEPNHLFVGDRRTIQCLKRAGKEFLKFGNSNRIEIQHNSVRDYIQEDEKFHVSLSTFCSECRKRHDELLTFESGEKYGHLLMVEHAIRALNSRIFQKMFVWTKEATNEKMDQKDDNLDSEREIVVKSGIVSKNMSRGRGRARPPEFLDKISENQEKSFVSTQENLEYGQEMIAETRYEVCHVSTHSMYTKSILLL